MRTKTAADRPARVAALEATVAAIGQTSGTLRCASSQRLLELGVSMTHFHVLSLLRHHDAMPVGRLAEILDTSVSGTTGIVDRMEERGLLERTRVADDRRVVLVRLTDTGADLVDQAGLIRSDVLSAALARLTDHELDRVGTALEDIRRAIEAELASAPDRYAALSECDHPHGHHGPHAH
jgi:DNA-binding MarR family transcriptional regulator